jgi:hypothetical protein
MDLVNVFDRVADQMRSDFEQARSSLNHAGLKGSAFEEGFRGFLRRYLPAKLDISQGTLVDASGNSSKQLDVIISDANATPIFYKSSDTRVLPVEMAYAVIEVKAHLDILELDRCLHNMMSVRNLSKTAFQPGTSSPIAMYGAVHAAWPINYYVFAIDSAPLDSLRVYLSDYYNNHASPPQRRIDTICVLNGGLILNRLESDMFDALPAPGSAVVSLKTKRPLLLFYALTSRYWFQATLPPFNILPYLGNMDFGQLEG